MILGRGTAQTDEAIIAEFGQFLEQVADRLTTLWV